MPFDEIPPTEEGVGAAVDPELMGLPEAAVNPELMGIPETV